ncbi:hypothetical protein [Kordia sp.]|uniref:hypothetical protein n=1 Tax=Kordia sp. TaxID=1965332 RepID=UPI003B596740
MKLKLFLFTISLMFVSCFSAEKEKLPEVKKEKRLFPVLKDTLTYKATRLNIKFMKSSNYRPIFLGKFTDTLVIDHYVNRGSMLIDSFESFRKHFRYYHRDFGKTTKASSKNINIAIDTTTIIKQVDFHDIGNNHFILKAYPLYISNISTKDTISLGFNFDIRTGLEAKNREGIWQPIERMTFVGCPVGLQEFVLKPGDTILTSTPIFKGDFKTKLRLRLGDTYSNEFEGYINEQQFVLSTF